MFVVFLLGQSYLKVHGGTSPIEQGPSRTVVPAALLAPVEQLFLHMFSFQTGSSAKLATSSSVLVNCSFPTKKELLYDTSHTTETPCPRFVPLSY